MQPPQSATDEPYAPGGDGIRRPRTEVAHRSDEYDEANYRQLVRMQREHFWYRGRHRFVLRALREHSAMCGSAVDLGGGCGGWVRYLHERAPHAFGELALADSSARGLALAEPLIGGFASRYLVDLLQLGWRDRWDVATLLDALEHVPEDLQVLQQVHRALRPGGVLLVTTPALQRFWSYNDELVHHVRRYSRADFARLAREAGFELVRSRYFMFFLSPLLLISRWRRVDVAAMTPEQVQAMRDRTHRVPSAPVNLALGAVFAAETPLGHWLPFPWGTSVLGVFRKPLRSR